ncbi:MAG TPA: carbon-nitrogen hydrolase family protein [Fimbriimonas sp.]|nr:carbon-nitrogen hydrolase family protein [Fimbriimonas sp.]
MKVAAVQMDLFYGKTPANVSRITRHLNNLKTQGVDLAVFPEAALTGYCADSFEEGVEIAIPAENPEPIQQLQELTDRLEIGAIVGYIESEGGKLYNTAALFEPGREPRRYRKTHLPFLGIDRFVTQGNELPVWDTRWGKIGILICFDLRPPEASRTLALMGADMIVLPTNWPEGADASAEHISIARAAENHVFVVTCNRVGTENGFRFIGRSKIIHPSGRILAAAEALEVILVAEIDPSEAREKRRVIIPGKYEIETVGARRLDLYG